jgi:hypothetical protein
MGCVMLSVMRQASKAASQHHQSALAAAMASRVSRRWPHRPAARRRRAVLLLQIYKGREFGAGLIEQRVDLLRDELGCLFGVELRGQAHGFVKLLCMLLSMSASRA